ncbi:hypothetical protein N7505_007591 [Penicillium chrysogenum]|uniref:Uncharacterized protein n=1 Tax=Penicillium chrysogenum TaxID=5076 RepID=A0ABQ8WDU7_PENCH|nr:hypothetical protein N7505_007591 [Penicillium chrysogenum]
MTLLQPDLTEKINRKIHIAQAWPNSNTNLLRFTASTQTSPWAATSPLTYRRGFQAVVAKRPLPLPRASTSIQELSRSARNKHAFSLHSRAMQPMEFASRKRRRSDSASAPPKKTIQASRKSSYQLTESSPGTNGYLRTLMAAAPVPGTPSVFHQPSDKEPDSELPLHSHQNASSTIGSSPPRTPPPKHSRLARTGRYIDDANRSGLSLYMVDSPPARVAGGNHYQVCSPSIPPSQHAVLPSMTPTLGRDMFVTSETSSQQFNFADFVNLTPSPTTASWDIRTPGNPPRIPTATK